MLCCSQTQKATDLPQLKEQGRGKSGTEKPVYPPLKAVVSSTTPNYLPLNRGTLASWRGQRQSEVRRGRWTFQGPKGFSGSVQAVSVLARPQQPEACLACLKPTFKFFPGLVSNPNRGKERGGGGRAAPRRSGKKRSQLRGHLSTEPVLRGVAGSRRGKP